eukprot:TRINITY_DN16311_c0_g1_i1.p3 TRINITY_DN16311_c0_g1~~TRINITY_DN16311_c0_g1_i1.p3  ORF type:complete len:128 (-),score=30.09 TRINITY_DN16311_c0_g1_i1:228-611(-)
MAGLGTYQYMPPPAQAQIYSTANLPTAQNLGTAPSLVGQYGQPGTNPQMGQAMSPYAYPYGQQPGTNPQLQGYGQPATNPQLLQGASPYGQQPATQPSMYPAQQQPQQSQTASRAKPKPQAKMFFCC